MLCGKPHKQKTELCAACKKKKKELNEKISKEHPQWKLYATDRILYRLKKELGQEDIFDFLLNDTQRLKMIFAYDKEDTAAEKKNYKAYTRSDQYRQEQYIRNVSDAPKYVQDIFEKLPGYTYIAIEGEKENPSIIFECKRCHRELCVKYSDLISSAAHNCESIKSSGEAVVEEYLKSKRIEYKTQQETLLCINPRTQRQLPYDFELSEAKVIIEVQGEQHFSYIPWFHLSEYDFSYQLWKDSFKKDYAISQGYSYIEINYRDINDGNFKTQLDKLLNGHS